MQRTWLIWFRYVHAFEWHDQLLTSQTINYITSTGAHAIVDPHNFGR